MERIDHKTMEHLSPTNIIPHQELLASKKGAEDKSAADVIQEDVDSVTSEWLPSSIQKGERTRQSSSS